MKSAGGSHVRAAESRSQPLNNTAAAPCSSLHAHSSTRTIDIQDKEEKVPQLQPEAHLGLSHLSFLTLSTRGFHAVPIPSVSVDAANPTCQHRSRAGICLLECCLFPEEQRRWNGSVTNSLCRPSPELGSNGFFDLQIPSASFTFPYQTLSWNLGTIIPFHSFNHRSFKNYGRSEKIWWKRD